MLLGVLPGGGCAPGCGGCAPGCGGCVLPGGGCVLLGVLPGVVGGCAPRWGVLPGVGVYLVLGVCVPGPGGAPGLGGCAPSLGGVPGLGGCTWSHSPPVDRITDACKNITLAQLRCGR